MVNRLVSVGDDYRFPSLVRNVLVSDIKTQINTGTTATTDSAFAEVLNNTASASRQKLDQLYPTGYVVVNRQPGIDVTGSADSSVALNALITSQPTGAYTNLVVLPSAFGRTTLRIDQTITLDITKVGLVAPFGGLQFDATHIDPTSGVAMQVTATTAVPNNSGMGGPKIGPFRLVGPGRANTNTVGILLSATSTSGGQVRNIVFDSVSVEEFGAGHKYGDNTYNVTWLNCQVKGCNIGTWAPAGTTNSGERLTYISSTFGECNYAVQNDAVLRFHLSACSLDYSYTRQVLLSGTGTIELVECHIEKSITQNPPWFEVAGGTLKVIGGTIVSSGTYSAATAPPYLVSNTADSTFTDGVAIFENVTFSNTLRTTTGFLASGPGATIVRNHTRTNQYQSAFVCTAASMNLLTRGNADAGVSISDRWLITSDTAALSAATSTTSAVTGSNGNLAPSADIFKSSPRSMKFTKTGNAGTALAFTVVVPIERSASVGAMGSIARHTTLTGTVGITFFYAVLTRPDITPAAPTNIGQQVVISSGTYNLTSDLSAVDTWYDIASAVKRAPAWATHFAVVVDLVNMGPGSLYLDDLCITNS